MNILIRNKNILIILVIFLISLSGCSEKDSSFNVYTVKKEKVIDTVKGRGDFYPENDKDINVPMGIWSTISYLAPEGSEVKEGDVIAEFNTRDIRERNKYSSKRLERDILRLENTKLENELTEIQEKNSLLEAEKKFELNKKKNKELLQGEDTREIKIQELSFKMSELESEYQQKNLEEKKSMFEQGFISELEYQKIDKNLKISALNLKRSENMLKDLKTRPYEDEKTKYRLQLEKAKMSYENLTEDQKSSKLSRDLTLKNRMMEIERTKKDVKRVEDRIKKSTLKSPIKGTLLYATDWNGKVRIGKRVWSGMNILKVTDLSSLKVKGLISQKDVDRIKKGNKVFIYPVALPEKTIKGTVSSIGRLGKLKDPSDPKGVKEFEVEIKLDEQLKDLKPNYSVIFEIVSKEKENIIKIPAECVYEKDDEFYVNKRSYSKSSPVKIEILWKNDDYYFIESGLDEGDKLDFNI